MQTESRAQPPSHLTMTFFFLLFLLFFFFLLSTLVQWVQQSLVYFRGQPTLKRQLSPPVQQRKDSTPVSHSNGPLPLPVLVHIVRPAPRSTNPLCNYSIDSSNLQPPCPGLPEDEPFSLSPQSASVKNTTLGSLRTRSDSELKEGPKCSRCGSGLWELAQMPPSGEPVLKSTCGFVEIISNDVTSWGIEGVMSFVAGLPGCKEYAEVGRKHNCFVTHRAASVCLSPCKTHYRGRWSTYVGRLTRGQAYSGDIVK